MDMPFPTVPDKHAYPSAYRPAAFLDSLRAGGWEPGPVPGSVVFTCARFELYLAAHPEAYNPESHGRQRSRTVLPGQRHGRAGGGVNCPGIGVAQLEAQAELGVTRCISIGTAGGFQAGQEPGDVVLLTSAMRDEGTSHHYLPGEAPAVLDRLSPAASPTR